MIIITGQTATGKTKLALEYAQKYNGELINFDSRQIYKYLDIITGKDLNQISNIKYQISTSLNIGYYQIPISAPLTDSIKLWLYDVVKPNQYFSSFEYVKIAQKVIKDIIYRGKTPILVGGTYFYLKHLLYGFDFSVPPDFKLREKLNKKSTEELQKILIDLNPKIKEKINQSDWQNPRRLIRKIEIENFKKLKGNIKKEKFSLEKILNINNPIKIIGLYFSDKEKLKIAIKNRVEKRLKQGAIEEVKKILSMGYKKTDPGLQTIGYKQIIEYLEGKIDLQNAINKWINAEIQYAKRQYTFMKKDKNIIWKQI